MDKNFKELNKFKVGSTYLIDCYSNGIYSNDVVAEELPRYKIGKVISYIPSRHHYKYLIEFEEGEDHYTGEGYHGSFEPDNKKKLFAGADIGDFVPRIKDTKIARKLNKNNIIKEEAGWFYLKD